MIKNVEVTLYDVFGYLFPGATLLLALATVAWSVFFPAAQLPVAPIPLEIWVLGTFVSYLLGHVLQAVACTLPEQLFPMTLEPRTKRQSDYAPASFVTAAYEKAATLIGVPADSITWYAFDRLCDVTIAQCGRVNDRDMHVYRIGFYRGMSVALFTLAAALALRAWIPGLSVRGSDAMAHPWPVVVRWMSGFFLLCAIMLYFRYRHFLGVRATSQIHAFLVLHDRKLLDAQAKEH